MPRKSAAGSLVRRSADDTPPPAPDHLTHLLGAMGGPVDTSEVPETTGRPRRVKRDASGRLPVRRESPIRSAILAELERRGMTRYQLWQEARAHCPTLPQSAVYEYLRGHRDVGVAYIEALLEAAGLVVGPRKSQKAPARRGAAKASVG